MVRLITELTRTLQKTPRAADRGGARFSFNESAACDAAAADSINDMGLLGSAAHAVAAADAIKNTGCFSSYEKKLSGVSSRVTGNLLKNWQIVERELTKRCEHAEIVDQKLLCYICACPCCVTQARGSCCSRLYQNS